MRTRRAGRPAPGGASRRQRRVASDRSVARSRSFAGSRRCPRLVRTSIVAGSAHCRSSIHRTSVRLIGERFERRHNFTQHARRGGDLRAAPANGARRSRSASAGRCGSQLGACRASVAVTSLVPGRSRQPREQIDQRIVGLGRSRQLHALRPGRAHGVACGGDRGGTPRRGRSCRCRLRRSRRRPGAEPRSRRRARSRSRSISLSRPTKIWGAAVVVHAAARRRPER